MRKTGKPKTETEWIIERAGGLNREYDTPLEAMQEAKHIYEDELKKHREYCDLMRQRRVYEGMLKHIDDRLGDYINDGHDLMPDIRVKAVFTNGDKETIWENGEAR